MKYSLFTIVLLYSATTIMAQNHTVSPKSNTIHFSSINNLVIEGYAGNEVIIESDNYTQEDEDNHRSAGLRLVNSEGHDNTNLGLSVKNEKESLFVSQVGYSGCGEYETNYHVKIPSDMNIVFNNSSWDGDQLTISNVSGEIEISTNYNDIKLNDVTGPMAIKTVYGSIDATFQKLSQVGSVTLYSVYEYVDISLPSQTQTSVNFKTNEGNIYTDMDISIDAGSKKKNWAGDKIRGTINGGGVDLTATSLYDNIYLRQAK